jgi:hypothetical protein
MRMRAEEEELRHLVRRVDALTALPLFASQSGPPAGSFTSLLLLSGVGYSGAYQALVSLRRGLSVDAGAIDASVKELHQVYEAWCYITVVRIVSEILHETPDLSQLIQVESSGIRVALRRGQASEVRWSSETRGLVAAYNPSFGGLTGTLRPDIVLRFNHAGWPDVVVVFAKYRLERSADYVKAFRTPGPPEDALGALHRYRDAILMDYRQPSLGRPVVKGLALFPLSAGDSESFSQTPLFHALDDIGVGAIPALPSNERLLREWLQGLLDMDIQELAVPGPPFAAYEELRRRNIC